NYGGEGGYPEGSEGVSTENPLNYVNLSSDGLVELNSSAYCAENTNTSDIVSANYPSAVTSILLKATVCDKNGQPLDLVRFNGVLFNRDSFIK
ncbi:hypothetical protein, partial [Klebsiella pneumoniae]|uniref:hypothetical protein n=1 Tax=Klebsiella pneumoniae TaxID=573 RepID=UPI003AF8173C